MDALIFCKDSIAPRMLASSSLAKMMPVMLMSCPEQWESSHGYTAQCAQLHLQGTACRPCDSQGGGCAPADDHSPLYSHQRSAIVFEQKGRGHLRCDTVRNIRKRLPC